MTLIIKGDLINHQIYYNHIRLRFDNLKIFLSNNPEILDIKHRFNIVDCRPTHNIHCLCIYHDIIQIFLQYKNGSVKLLEHCGHKENINKILDVIYLYRDNIRPKILKNPINKIYNHKINDIKFWNIYEPN